MTTAIADQIVVTLKSQPSQELLQKLQDALQQLNALPTLGANGTPAAVAAAVAEVQQQIDSELHDSGLLTNPPPTTTASTTTAATTTAATHDHGNDDRACRNDDRGVHDSLDPDDHYVGDDRCDHHDAGLHDDGEHDDNALEQAERRRREARQHLVRVVDRREPLVGDALRVVACHTGRPEAREAALVHLAGRERRVLDHRAVEALVREPDRRLRNAHVRLAADEHGAPPTRRAHRLEDLRSPRQPERRLPQHRRPVGELHCRRAVSFRLLLRRDDRDPEPGRQPGEPSRPRAGRVGSRPVELVEPVADEEAGLQVDDDEHRAVAIEQSHGPEPTFLTES